MKDQFHRGGVRLEKALAFWVERVQHASRSAMYKAFREATGAEVTPEQWLVLVHLAAEGGCTQSELGELVRRDRPTTSRIVSGMVKRKLVRRSRDGGDERVWRLHLTSEGERTFQLLLPVAQRLVRRLERGIAERDLEVTRRTLRAVFLNLDE